jgi:hypothetical protein
MSLPEIVGEPILVQARFLPDGRVQPTAFIWHDRTRYVASLGREWSEEGGEARWRCYLVQTPNGETFELHLDLTAMRWILARAWLHPAPRV